LQDTIKSNSINSGRILIDQLMIAGNKQNRFLSMDIEDGQFDFNSAQNVDAPMYYHQLTSSELKRNKTMLNNSVLSPMQIDLLSQGCVV